jgi:hypothetical protein
MDMCMGAHSGGLPVFLLPFQDDSYSVLAKEKPPYPVLGRPLM